MTFSIVLLLLAVLCARAVARPRRRRHLLRYRLYLRSPLLWRLRRRIWIIRAGGCCRQCGSRRRLTIHHRTYARLGHERYADITVLCSLLAQSGAAEPEHIGRAALGNAAVSTEAVSVPPLGVIGAA
jgi:hypothetical protein